MKSNLAIIETSRWKTRLVIEAQDLGTQGLRHPQVWGHARALRAEVGE